MQASLRVGEAEEAVEDSELRDGEKEESGNRKSEDFVNKNNFLYAHLQSGGKKKQPEQYKGYKKIKLSFPVKIICHWL